MDASLMKASALRLRFSQSLASRRQRLSQAMVRSTTQRLGWTTKPFTRSDRLTISVSRSGRMPARAGERPAPDRRCRRTISRERETDRTRSPAARDRRRDPELGGGDDAGSSKPCVSTRTCRFLPLISLPASKPWRRCEPPFFSAFHTLTVDDAGRGAGFARGFLAALEVERDGCDPACRPSAGEVIMHGASGRQILGQRAPLAAGAQNVHHAVDHLADSDAPFAAAGLARRDQRLDMRPFRIGQVARITQFVAVVARAVVGSPHGAPQEQIHHPRESQLIQLFKRGRRITDSSDS